MSTQPINPLVRIASSVEDYPSLEQIDEMLLTLSIVPRRSVEDTALTDSLLEMRELLYHSSK